MNRCPNCGAPVTKSKCEYCDTVFGERYSTSDEYVFVDELESLQKELNIMYEQRRIDLEKALSGYGDVFDEVDAVINVGTWIALALGLFVIICLL